MLLASTNKLKDVDDDDDEVEYLFSGDNDDMDGVDEFMEIPDDNEMPVVAHPSANPQPAGTNSTGAASVRGTRTQATLPTWLS